MTDIPKMVYPHGFSKTRVGAPTGAVIPGSMPDENKLCTNNCAKSTAAFSIKMQTGGVVEQREAVATGIRLRSQARYRSN